MFIIVHIVVLLFFMKKDLIVGSNTCAGYTGKELKMNKKLDVVIIVLFILIMGMFLYKMFFVDRETG